MLKTLRQIEWNALLNEIFFFFNIIGQRMEIGEESNSNLNELEIGD